MFSKSAAKRWMVGIAFGSLSAVALAADNCGDVPVAPELPDGTTASLDELVDTSNAVRNYIEDADKYLDCKESFARKRDFQRLSSEAQDAYREEVSVLTAKRNEVGDLFNAEVEAYRQANPDE